MGSITEDEPLAASPTPLPGLPAPTLSISSAFESGNIEVLDASDPSNIRLAIRPDPFCDSDSTAHFQWFYFAVSGAAGVPLVMHITNAGKASYPDAWPGYSAVCSSDLVTWVRLPTTYAPNSGTLTLTHTPPTHHVRYSFFAPYTNERVDALVAGLAGQAGVYLQTLPPTHEGRPMYMLRISHPGLADAATPPVPQQQQRERQRRLAIWVLARQHPGEPQGSWFVEGMLKTLAAAAAREATGAAVARPAAASGGSSRADGDPDEPSVLEAAAALLREAVVYVVPNMCPDGVARGHLRTNALGANLNREWALPGDPALSPEVFYVRQAMVDTGVDMLLDVHGDEELPAVFVSGLDGLPSWGPRLQALQDGFKAIMVRRSRYFQTTLGYGTPAPNSANLAICSKAVAAQWGCLALTLEMPFKDAGSCPDEVHGWSPERCQELGRHTLGGLLDMVPLIRTHQAPEQLPQAAQQQGSSSQE